MNGKENKPMFFIDKRFRKRVSPESRRFNRRRRTKSTFISNGSVCNKTTFTRKCSFSKSRVSTVKKSKDLRFNMLKVIRRPKMRELIKECFKIINCKDVF